MARVQTVAGAEFEKERHRRSQKMRVGRPASFAHIDIGFYDPPIVIHIVAVKTGTMIPVFANNAKMPDGRFVSFAASGDVRHGDFLPALE